MLRNRREEKYKIDKALEVIGSFEKIVRNLQIRLKAANNELVMIERDNK